MSTQCSQVGLVFYRFSGIIAEASSGYTLFRSLVNHVSGTVDVESLER